MCCFDGVNFYLDRKFLSHKYSTDAVQIQYRCSTDAVHVQVQYKNSTVAVQDLVQYSNYSCQCCNYVVTIFTLLESQCCNYFCPLER